MANDDIQPKAKPSLNLPKSDSTVEVSIIHTTTDIVVPASAFVEPVLKGHETMNMPTFAFLVKNKKLGKNIMFDLGCRKDWWNFAPAALNSIKNSIPGLNVAKNINEIMEEGKEDVGKIDGIVWSHWHWVCHYNTYEFSCIFVWWDQRQRSKLIACLFRITQEIHLSFQNPRSSLLVRGSRTPFCQAIQRRKILPCLKRTLSIVKTTSRILSLLTWLNRGRKVREIEFNKDNRIGQYPSYDLFGDGSFYILDVPGHAIGHISVLARTTPDTFVFMGGDVCHFGGSYRPTAYAPLPATIPPGVTLDERFSSPCPCSIFTACHRDPDNARTSPFYQVTQNPKGWYIDPVVAQQSVFRLEEFDADDDVFVCVAHDGGLIPVVEWFPDGTLNDWKAKGWKEKSKWGFLNELPIDGKPGRPLLAPGLVRDGHVVEKVDRLGPVAGQH